MLWRRGVLVLVAWFAVGVGLPASAAEPPARSYVSGFGSCVVMAGWLRPGRLPPGCVATAGFHNRDAVVSPDGNIFYSVGGWDGLSTLRVFQGNPGTGLLAPAGGRFGFRIDPATGAVTGLCCS